MARLFCLSIARQRGTRICFFSRSLEGGGTNYFVILSLLLSMINYILDTDLIKLRSLTVTFDKMKTINIY